MLLATDYPFMSIMWTMLVFFAWVIWIWLLIMVLADNFRRADHSGWAKAGWTLFVIFLPLVGVLVYIIAAPHKATALAKPAGARAPGFAPIPRRAGGAHAHPAGTTA